MRKDKEQATVLRKSGMSYSDIISRMGVPRSTLSKWFRDQNWSNQIAIECADKSKNQGALRFAFLNTVHRGRLDSVRKAARQDAVHDFECLKYHPLFVSGVISYWMHGDMTSRNRVCFSSSDPQKIIIFKLFLDRICGITKPKVWINIKRGNLVFLAISFWANQSGLDENLIGKTVVSGRFDDDFISKSKNTDKKYSSILNGFKRQKVGKIGNNHGICNMVVNSTYLKNKFLKWIELLKVDLINEGYLSAGIV